MAKNQSPECAQRACRPSHGDYVDMRKRKGKIFLGVANRRACGGRANAMCTCNVGTEKIRLKEESLVVTTTRRRCKSLDEIVEVRCDGLAWAHRGPS